MFFKTEHSIESITIVIIVDFTSFGIVRIRMFAIEELYDPLRYGVLSSDDRYSI
jgi:hypothetical protein